MAKTHSQEAFDELPDGASDSAVLEEEDFTDEDVPTELAAIWRVEILHTATHA